MGFRNVAQVAAAYEKGRFSYCSFRKVPSQGTAAGNWVDLTMAAGNPVPQYYASSPLEAAVLNGDKGIFHGDEKSPYTKFIHNFGIVTPSIGFLGQFTIMDYLLYYPFVDGDSLDIQPFINDVTLPRFTDGEGVYVMAVASAPTLGGGSFTFDYIDHAGNSKTSPVISCNTTAANIATLITSQQATVAGGLPFLPLAEGSRGVRRITGVTNISAIGGLFALVLVKPLFDTAIREVSTMTEINFVNLRPILPKVEDGAYLGMICNCSATVAGGLLTGYANFIWGND